jgi:hypothetical protein
VGYGLVDWRFHLQFVFQRFERRIKQNLVPPDVSARLVSDEQNE